MPIRKIERNKSIRGSEDEDASPEGIPWKRMVTMVVARIIQSSHKKEERRPDQSGQERDSQIERERQRPETRDSERPGPRRRCGFICRGLGGSSHDKGEPSKKQRWLGLLRRAMYSQADSSAVPLSFLSFCVVPGSFLSVSFPRGPWRI